MPKNDLVTNDCKYEVVDNSDMYGKELCDLAKAKAHTVTNEAEDFSVKASALILHWVFNQLQLAIEDFFSA